MGLVYSIIKRTFAVVQCPDQPAACLYQQATQLLEMTAHRIVRLLVRQRWMLADLDSLPWGVALPLRQVSNATGNGH